MTPQKHTCHRGRGYSLAEMPAGLILLFIGLFIPFVIMISITYRVSILWFATRDSCIKAAKAATFTDAQSRALSNFARNIAGFPYISGTPTVEIMSKPVAGGPPVFSSTKLAVGSVNTSDNLYFIRETVNGTISPLVTMGSYFGTQIPGLTGPLNVTTRCEGYVENPNGLTE